MSPFQNAAKKKEIINNRHDRLPCMGEEESRDSRRRHVRRK